MKKNKNLKQKNIAVLGILSLFTLINSSQVQAEKLNDNEFHSNVPYIMLEDIFDLNAMYMENPELSKADAYEYLVKKAENYAGNQNLIEDNKEETLLFDVLIKDDDIGYFAYTCLPCSTISSSLGENSLYLEAACSSQELALDVSKEGLDEFVADNNKLSEERKRVCDYVKNNLQTTEYMDVSVSEEGTVYVLLTDKSKAEMLENENIAWKPSDISREELYGELRYLWENREELRIVNADIKYGRLFIEGLYNESEFKKVYSNDKEMEYTYSQSPSDLEESIIRNMESFFEKELIEFAAAIPYSKNEKNPFDEADFGDPELLAVKVVLQKYKELYPEKTYETLYHTYIKEINESTVLTQEEKRGRYEWKLLGIQKEMKELKENEKKEVPIPAIAGCVVLVLGVFGMVVVKRKGR